MGAKTQVYAVERREKWQKNSIASWKRQKVSFSHWIHLNTKAKETLRTCKKREKNQRPLRSHQIICLILNNWRILELRVVCPGGPVPINTSHWLMQGRPGNHPVAVWAKLKESRQVSEIRWGGGLHHGKSRCSGSKGLQTELFGPGAASWDRSSRPFAWSWKCLAPKSQHWEPESS